MQQASSEQQALTQNVQHQVQIAISRLQISASPAATASQRALGQCDLVQGSPLAGYACITRKCLWTHQHESVALFTVRLAVQLTWCSRILPFTNSISICVLMSDAEWVEAA